MKTSACIDPSAPLAVPIRVFRPPLPNGYVLRPRLCAQLADHLSSRLLLICAPAGFGKSCLALEFTQYLPASWRSLWLGLSERDADPGRFYERLLETLHELLGTFASDALEVLKLRQRHQPFDYESWLSSWLDLLAQQICNDRPVLLVLDDYHLAGSAVIERSLQFFINHLPSGLACVVTSRQRPDWHLARLRLTGQVFELQEHDLRLDQAEVRALLEAHGLSAQHAEYQQLLERSEGWVAGLRLWLLALADGERDALAGQAMVRDYLLEEVIERQSPEVQQFLFETAMLDRLCAPLCDAVRDGYDSQSMLEQLKHHQVFLVPLDSHGQWYRYHHLFSDLLRAKGPATPGVSQLHLKACRWFAEQGMFEEAVEHALKAGHTEAAASLVQQFSEEQLLAEQNVSRLLRWKMDLPAELLASTPRLIMLYSWALLLACQLDAAQALASRMEHFLPAPSGTEEQSLRLSWLAISGAIARGRGDMQRAELCCSQALAFDVNDNPGARLICLATLANLAVVRGELWRARGLNREALELARRQANPLLEAYCHYDRARLLTVRGEVVRAEDEIKKGLQLLKHLPNQQVCTVQVRLRLYQGVLLTQRLQVESGSSQLREAIAQAKECRDIGLLLGYCLLASQEGRQGQFAEAFALLAEVERLMHIWDIPPVYYLAMVTLTKCELWLAQGQLSLAQLWLQRLYDTYCVAPAAMTPEFHPLLALHIELNYAMLERRLGQPEHAERRLHSLLARCHEQGSQMMAGFVQTQLSLLLYKRGAVEQAREHLQRSFNLARGGCLLPFAELIERYPRWLREQLHKAGMTTDLQALLVLLPDEPIDCSPLADALSSRELAVLELIAQGYSNLQISERLFISLHTVKTHARNINSKLNVQRRTQAVAKAKALGVL